MEIFKPIEIDGYEVSNLGTVRNSVTGKSMKFYDVRGYKRINIKDKNGEVRRFQIHRLALETFTEKRPEMTVNHINYIKDDNRLENLEWMTREENTKNSVRRRFPNGKSMKDKIKELYESNICNSIDEFYKAIMKL